MICLDASVVGKLICPDEEAFQVLEKYEKARTAGKRFLSPALLPYEVASLLRKKRLKKILSGAESLGAIHLFRGLEIELTHFEDIMERVLTLCEAFGSFLTVYDASYLAVAEKEKATLWTADRDFFRTISVSFPDVELMT